MLGMLGLAMALGGAALGGVVQFDQPLGRAFRLAVGTILIVFGLKQARLVNFRMKWMYSVASSAGQRFDPSRTTTRSGGDVLYGFGYLLAGFG
jgi:cytochrome c biogenesis protein CcdA